MPRHRPPRSHLRARGRAASAHLTRAFACTVVAAAVSLIAGCTGGTRAAQGGGGISLEAALGDQAGDGGFRTITAPPTLSFPADHGPHPAFRQEWWYFTGNLTTPEGRRFGYQATIFRFATGDAETAPSGASRWRASQLYMGHLAVSDVDGGAFHAADRFARGALGLAGAQAAPLKVWVEDWTIVEATVPPSGGSPPAAQATASRAATARSGATAPPASTAAPPLPRDVALPPAAASFDVHLAMADDAMGVDLRLRAMRPIVPQGVDGYSQKGEDPANASAYYSIPRLRTTGEVRVNGERFSVEGSSWFDREWGTSFLPPGVAGWDWFSLQLDDGSDLMVYRLRTDEGEATAYSAGTLLRPDGAGGFDTVRLTAADLRARPDAWWRSPATGVRYPVAWSLAVPAQGLALRVEAALDAQELRLGTRYWEGAVTVSGHRGDAAVGGRGYLELAGYEAGPREASSR